MSLSGGSEKTRPMAPPPPRPTPLWWGVEVLSRLRWRLLSAAVCGWRRGGAEPAATELAEARAQSMVAAAAARRAVDGSAHLLNARLTEGVRLTTQIEAARMQERMADTLKSLDAMAPGGSTPSLE